jgi:excisionase family DNA binding protein
MNETTAADVDECLSLSRAAKILGVCVRTVRRQIDRRRPKAFRVRRNFRIRTSEATIHGTGGNWRMMFFVFRPKRRVKGKLCVARTYTGQVRLPGDGKATRVPLGVTDKQVAK